MMQYLQHQAKEKKSTLDSLHQCTQKAQLQVPSRPPNQKVESNSDGKEDSRMPIFKRNSDVWQQLNFCFDFEYLLALLEGIVKDKTSPVSINLILIYKVS